MHKYMSKKSGHLGATVASPVVIDTDEVLSLIDDGQKQASTQIDDAQKQDSTQVVDGPSAAFEHDMQPAAGSMHLDSAPAMSQCEAAIENYVGEHTKTIDKSNGHGDMTLRRDLGARQKKNRRIAPRCRGWRRDRELLPTSSKDDARLIKRRQAEVESDAPF